MNKSPRAVHEIHYRYKKLFVINVNKPLEICSDIGFAAFGVTGRAVIDFALLTSQASKVKITQSSIIFINLERIHACYLLSLHIYSLRLGSAVPTSYSYQKISRPIYQ